MATALRPAPAAPRPRPLLLLRRPPPLLLSTRAAAARPSSTAAASEKQLASPCDIEDAYFFVPPLAAVRAAAQQAAESPPPPQQQSPPPSSSDPLLGPTTSVTSDLYYGGSPPSSPSQSQTPQSQSSFWGAVGHLAARAAEASAPQVVLIPNALPPSIALQVARECRALRPKLAPELNCIASGRLGCYLSARSATHAALSDKELAERLTRKLRSALPLSASEFPMELRHYPSGSSMPWHSDEALYGPQPQWELIYTVDNDSDSETEWRDAQGRLHGAWTPPGSLLCVRAEGWQHRVTPVRRGSRLIVKLAYAPEGAAKLPSFAQNLGRAAYGRPSR